MFKDITMIVARKLDIYYDNLVNNSAKEIYDGKIFIDDISNNRSIIDINEKLVDIAYKDLKNGNIDKFVNFNLKQHLIFDTNFFNKIIENKDYELLSDILSSDKFDNTKIKNKLINNIRDSFNNSSKRDDLLSNLYLSEKNKETIIKQFFIATNIDFNKIIHSRSNKYDSKLDFFKESVEIYNQKFGNVKGMELINNIDINPLDKLNPYFVMAILQDNKLSDVESFFELKKRFDFYYHSEEYKDLFKNINFSSLTNNINYLYNGETNIELSKNTNINLMQELIEQIKSESSFDNKKIMINKFNEHFSLIDVKLNLDNISNTFTTTKENFENLSKEKVEEIFEKSNQERIISFESKLNSIDRER